MISRFSLPLLALLALPGAALAADATVGPYEAAPAPLVTAANDYGDSDIVIELGISGIMVPSYEGSDDVDFGVSPIIDLEYLNIPGIGAFGGKDGRGFSIGPSFGYTGERDEDDLVGLNDVDATYEIGLKASYEWDYAEIYGAGRYAFGGAEGVIGEVGGNLIARPTEAWELKAGPLATFASSGYMDEYFSVSAAEAARSGGKFDAYEADGGFKSVGVAASAKYEVFTDWFLRADASYERLVSDAKDSPVVDAGSADQFRVGLGVSHRFSLDLF
ncbi:MipA/OmpV family protein [Aurantimonas sp. Leaf443]|uniref:MipA/OmpV family protein n=1 Tax=Aurantimonas sp. Leaf443 TaxID=1736378 RepID=UPI0006F3DD33|nr:MipA/OmpV family protein [Aurantimonas sp. Leaf443]KQT84011.1 structural protein MipA [Aurantimonas sp. Leaf443]